MTIATGGVFDIGNNKANFSFRAYILITWYWKIDIAPYFISSVTKK